MKMLMPTLQFMCSHLCSLICVHLVSHQRTAWNLSMMQIEKKKKQTIFIEYLVMQIMWIMWIMWMKWNNQRKHVSIFSIQNMTHSNAYDLQLCIQRKWNALNVVHVSFYCATIDFLIMQLQLTLKCIAHDKLVRFWHIFK